MLDVELSLLPDAKPLADGARVRVHAASAEGLARVRLLEQGPLAPGGSALAQLRLEAPLVAGRGDRLVIRSYSPAATIGGAVVVDALPPRRRVADRRGGRAPARRGLPRRGGRGRRRGGRHQRHRGAAARGAPDRGDAGAGAGARGAPDARRPRGRAGAAAGASRPRPAAGRDARVARGLSPREPAAARDAARGAAPPRVRQGARGGLRACGGRAERGVAGAAAARHRGPGRTRGAPQPRRGGGSQRRSRPPRRPRGSPASSWPHWPRTAARTRRCCSGSPACSWRRSAWRAWATDCSSTGPSSSR